MNIYIKYSISYILIIIFLCSTFIGQGNISRAATVEEIQSKINNINSQRQQILAEIKQYEGKLDVTGKQIQTLQNTLKTLDLSRNKLLAELRSTEKNISATNLTIEKIEIEIGDMNEQIDLSKLGLAKSLHVQQEIDETSMIELVLAKSSLSDVWQDIDALQSFEDNVKVSIQDLEKLQNELEKKMSEMEGKKKSLVKLKDSLSDQKKLVDQNAKEKNSLLTTTKNQESTFKKILAEKKARAEALEKELFAYESELKIAVDFGKLPKFGTGVISWPVANIRITQQFGDTAFARANAGVYNGKGHNGIDLGVPIGTPIYAASSGTVLGTGDTDTVCAGASYGRWVFIRHNNGLSTLYAHLSIIKAVTGTSVGAGDIIGYSGNTGYSTGPHLHFTVYASDGVRISTLQSKACGGMYTIPVADLRAYLNPLLYL